MYLVKKKARRKKAGLFIWDSNIPKIAEKAAAETLLG